MQTIIENPWSGALIEYDVAQATHEMTEAWAQVMDDEELEQLHGAETPAEWTALLITMFGPERAGVIILGS
jgi:hypothetical protein